VTPRSSRSRTAALLDAATASDRETSAFDELVPIVYEELRALARRQLAHEGRPATLQTTELVHEAYLRLVDDAQVTRRGRAYFFAAAAHAMRRVLVDRARRRSALKRGSAGGAEPMLSLDEVAVPIDTFADDLLDLDAALGRLAEFDERKARIVECRYFGGLDVDETAEALDISPRTVKSDWAVARAWLYNALSERRDPK